MFRLHDGNTAILHAVAKRDPDSDRPSVKTTVELPGELWRAAKIKAMDDRVDLRTVLIRALERYLGDHDSRAPAARPGKPAK